MIWKVLKTHPNTPIMLVVWAGSRELEKRFKVRFPNIEVMDAEEACKKLGVKFEEEWAGKELGVKYEDIKPVSF